MSDLISRQAAIDAIEGLQDCYDGFSDSYDKACIIGVIEELPTVQERVKGRWRPVQIGKWHGFECTACKITREVPCTFRGKPDWKFCPSCGADMKEEDAE